MDRRTLLAVFLCLIVYYGWFVLRGPPPEAEGIEPADGVAEVVADGPTAEPEPAPAQAPRSDLPVRDVTQRACDASGVWSTDGGGLHGLKLLEHEEPYHITPLYTWLVGVVTGGDASWRPYGDDPGPITVITEKGSAMAVGAGDGDARVRMQVVEEGPGRIVLQGLTAEGIEVRQEISASGGTDEPCLLDVVASWRNTGTGAYAGPLWMGVHDAVPEAASGMMAAYSSVASVQGLVDGDLYYGDPSEIREASEAMEGPVGWFGIADRYFGLLVVPTAASGSLSFTALGDADDARVGARYTVADQLAPGASEQVRFRAYVGPLSTDRLQAADVALGLEDDGLAAAVDFGWFSVFAYPLLWLLHIFHAGVGNWGVAILLLTFSVKAVFFPLTQAAFKSGQAMQAIQPQLQELREQYKDNNEELNRKMMELFQEHGVNPLGGCLPMVIQLPVFFALYRVLLGTVDLYHTEFLYLLDLSSPDPYCALPVLVIVIMLIQQQFTPTGNMDPAQARMMKVMPIMFGLFFFVLPSGLVLYIFMNTLISVLQQWLIKRNWRNPEPPAMAGTQTAPATGA